VESVTIDVETGEETRQPLTPEEIADAEARAAAFVVYAGVENVNARARTTDAAPVDIYRLACNPKTVYQSTLTLIGIDAVSGATKAMEGRFVHKRANGDALQVGQITVISDIHDTAAASWAPSAVLSGTDVVFTVRGAAGRTVDWQMGGTIARYAPEGETS
jgi:hypothetical protein